jgi:5S rRNA maturation endonuclease (ribonuclease M5)
MYLKGKKVLVDIKREIEPYEHQFRKARWSDDKLISCSPLRSDDHPSFFVRLEPFGDVPEGTWSDSGGEGEYKSGNFIKLLSFLNGLTYDETENYLYETYGSEFYTGEVRLKMPVFNVDSNKLTIDPKIIANYQNPCDYLRNRGISDDVQTLFKTGYNESTNSVILPWYDANNILRNVKYRRTDGKLFYYEKGGTPIQQLLYGIDYIYANNIDTAALVESEIDALTLLTAGMPAIALGGSSVSNDKVNLLIKSPIKNLIVMTDNDNVGLNIRKQINKKLNTYLSISHAYVPHPYKDVNEARDPELLRNCVNGAIPVQRKLWRG